MDRMGVHDVSSLCALGEGQRVEFKEFDDLEGHAKNVLCAEIAAMANAGGGRIIVGVEDGSPGVLVGAPEQVVRPLTEAGWLHKLLRERVSPVPEVSAYAVPMETDLAAVVIDVGPPWAAREPVFAPIILLRDVADERGRHRYAKGTILYRDHTDCRVVMEHRQWERMMSPILDRFQEARMKPLLRQLVGQDLVAKSSVYSRRSEFANAIPDFEELAAQLQKIEPQATRYESRLVLDGVDGLRYQDQHRLISTSSVYHRGWSFPVHHDEWIREEGRLHHRYHGPESHAPLGPPKDVYQEFWIFTPNGVFGASLLDRVDLHTDFNGYVPPRLGPDRPLDSVSVAWSVVEFVEFVRLAAEESKASNLWCSFSLANVLNRPLGAFDPASPMSRRFDLNTRCRSNRRDIVVEGEFDTDTLKVVWRDVAVEWTREIFARFGLDVSAEKVRDVHDHLLYHDFPWNRGPAPSAERPAR